MVQFTSLDPIAEARAQVKLRYSRARPVRAPMKPLGLMAERVGRKAGTAKLIVSKFKTLIVPLVAWNALMLALLIAGLASVWAAPCQLLRVPECEVCR